MATPIMPKATAMWLIDNTTLSFTQIAGFCGLHVLEVQAIADGDAGTGVPPVDPVARGELTMDEIERCQNDIHAVLVMAAPSAHQAAAKSSKYTPIARRQDRPDAISWVVKNHPEMTDAQIVRLLGTTKNMITSIRGRTHWNIANMKPRHPVALGFCTEADLERAIAKSQPR